MSNEKCEVIRDLLPIYIDNICSEESRRIVSEHLKSCEHCRQLYQNMSQNIDAHLPDTELDSKKAFQNIQHKWSRLMISILSISVLVTALVTWLSIYLSLKITHPMEVWIRNTTFELDGGSFMKTLLFFIAAAAIVGLIQMFLFNRIRIKVLKYIPAIVFASGLVFCFLLYAGVFGTGSPSVVAENQYFAMFLAVPLGGGLMGSLLGSLYNRKNRKI